MKLFKHLTNGYLFSLRLGMTIVFLTLFAISTLLIIFFTSLGFSRAYTYLSTDLMKSVSGSINRELINLLEPTLSSAVLSSWLLEDKTVNPKNFAEITEYTQDLLQVLPKAQYAYFGDTAGNYVNAHREPDNTISTELIERQKTPPEHFIFYRNNQGQIINTEKKIMDFDPRTRPWYLIAKDAKKPVWTEPYLFYPINKVGITAAAPVYDNGQFKGVFGVDIGLDSLAAFLTEHKISPHGIALILNKNGEVIAYPSMLSPITSQQSNIDTRLLTVQQLNLPFINTAFEIFKESGRQKFNFNYHHQDYLASFMPISTLPGHDWYITIIVPKADFISQLENYNKLIMFILLLLSLLGVVAISLFAKRISIPINNLANELEEIKFFRIELNPPMKTHIKEVFIMSRAIESMKIGLASFRKYVPENLVRQLIYTGQAAKIGGIHRNVVLFFSDIVNFTAITEHVGPEKIMGYLCDYFEAMSQIITDNKGTVDKYMGDSIMAFWGAPLTDEKGIEHACKAALQCQSRLQLLNQEWRQAKRVALPTRIGLHFGDVTLGNLGSSERLNYTAIGDSVNIASRLEQLNKYYGTKIIVSDFIRDKMNELFLFRIIDRVIVKGRKEPITVYELIQEKTYELQTELYDFCDLYQQGFNAYQHESWDNAIEYFKSALKIHPHDFASHIMINRCHQLKKKPPPENWSGIWIFTTKK